VHLKKKTRQSTKNIQDKEYNPLIRDDNIYGKVSLWSQLKTLFANYNFMLLVIIGGSIAGSEYGWQAILDDVLEPIGYTQEETAWIGIAALIAGIPGGILIGKLVDYFLNYKILLFICL